MTTQRKILVTSALPYANGPLHLGHMVEFIQADVWARLQNMLGHHCTYVCGDDAHGTPIMLKAEQMGITPEELIATIFEEHSGVINDFHIKLDNFYTTHAEENKTLSAEIYKRLQARGDITTRTIEQSFDPEKEMFLPDRYVKGTCPRCKTADQHGDNCESCGATYDPTELIDPVSVVSGATPVQKSSEHYFFQLPHYTDLLKKWGEEALPQDAVRHKLQEWFDVGLRDWDISRDAPYFGFEIPDHPGKYFYVWLDAPIGYIASFKNLCDRRDDLNVEEYWKKGSTTELHQFVGKDIIYFHALFWPAMLAGSDHRLPTSLRTHGFLTVDGKKMSKSRGTFIKARTFLDHFSPDYIRYYIVAKLSSGIEDIDLNFEDFVSRVNSDLVGKVVNIASRCAGFINKRFEGKLADRLSEPELYAAFVKEGDDVAALFDKGDYSQAVRKIMALADRANQYIDEHKPWVLAKEEGKQAQVQAVCSMGLNLFRVLITYLKPIIPVTAEKSESFLQIPEMQWAHLQEPLLGHTIAVFKPLITRIDMDTVEKLKAQTKEDVKGESRKTA